MTPIYIGPGEFLNQHTGADDNHLSPSSVLPPPPILDYQKAEREKQSGNVDVYPIDLTDLQGIT